MAYINERGSLVTQGDEELKTIATGLGLLRDTAGIHFGDKPDKVEGLRKSCTRLSGRVATLFFMTPGDNIDRGSQDVPIARIAENLGVEESALDFPEVGSSEHEFESPEGDFIVMALLTTRRVPPVDESNQQYVVQADLMLQQLGH